jgi:hypothetical protein
MIILATGANAAYMPKLTAYLNSISLHSTFDRNMVIFVGNGAMPELNIECYRLREEAISAPAQNSCIQHGDWLNADGLQVDDSDVVVFTDGDMYVQRALNDKERASLEKLQHGDIVVGANQFEGQTLLQEAHNLGFTGKPWHGMNNEKVWRSPVFNTGCIAATVGTWRNLLSLYRAEWQDFAGVFQHYAKQQWLISYLLHAYSFNIKKMHYTFHLHNHGSAMPSGSVWSVTKNALTYQGDIVLLRHFTNNGASYTL